VIADTRGSQSRPEKSYLENALLLTGGLLSP
jgi:hypothetical protein